MPYFGTGFEYHARMKKVFALALMIISTQALYGQNANNKWTLGFGFGLSWRQNNGSHIVSDSLLVYSVNSGNANNNFRLFSDYQINEKLSWMAGANFHNQLLSIDAVNKDLNFNGLGTVTKGTVAEVTNLNIENSLTLDVRLFGLIRTSVLAGLRTNFTFNPSKENLIFRNGERHQGLAEALNQSHETIKPVYFNYILGVKSNWRRFGLLFQWDKSIGSVTNDLQYFGRAFHFHQRSQTFTLTLNYDLLYTGS